MWATVLAVDFVSMLILNIENDWPPRSQFGSFESRDLFGCDSNAVRAGFAQQVDWFLLSPRTRDEVYQVLRTPHIKVFTIAIFMPVCPQFIIEARVRFPKHNSDTFHFLFPLSSFILL